MPEKFDAMVCTVGENPLPVYLGIAQLTSDNAEVILLHSEGTRSQAERITKCVAMRPGNRRTVRFHSESNGDEECLLDNPWDFPATSQKFNDLYKSKCALNITGGTNVMTSTGYHIWTNLNKKENQNNPIVYLEEKSQKFRFSDGNYVNLDFTLDIQTLCDLHNTEDSPRLSNFPENCDLYLERLFQIFGHPNERYNLRHVTKSIPENATDTIYFHNGNNSPMFNWLITRRNGKTEVEKRTGAEIWEDLTNNFLNFWQESATDIENKINSYPDWKEFVESNPPNKGILKNETGKRILFVRKGFWFERLVMNTLIYELSEKYDISRSNHFNISDQEFEVDGICLANNRLHLISVTTEKQLGPIKEKAFEVMHRAQQLGGGLACSCVIAPTSEANAAKCQSSIDASTKKRHLIIPVPIEFKADFSNWKANLAEKFKDFLEGVG